jgi:hypothetical protein
MSRVLLTLLTGVVTAIGVGLLLLREESHFMRHTLPIAVIVAIAASVVTWRRIGSTPTR